jgi:hypothetical protein
MMNYGIKVTMIINIILSLVFNTVIRLLSSYNLLLLNCDAKKINLT